jgi:hypothetical protein
MVKGKFKKPDIRLMLFKSRSSSKESETVDREYECKLEFKKKKFI